MECHRRKLPEGISAYIGSLWSIERGEGMGNIKKGKLRVYSQQLAFDAAYEEIPWANIGRERDQRHG